MNAEPKSHGLDGSLVEPDWPPLTLEEVRALLAQFPDCGEPAEILSCSPRPFSAAGVVATRSVRIRGERNRGERIFVKRHHQLVRDREGLLEEHRFIEYLREHGASVPRVLASASGETAIEMGDSTYEVHETPVGVDLYEDAISWTPFRSPHHAFSAGQAMAELHLASRGYDAPARKVQPLVAGFNIFACSDPERALSHYLSARPALSGDSITRDTCGEALELLAPFYRELRPLLPDLAPLWTHNDLHASNLIWSSGGADAQVTAVIDFGLADRTHAVHDLAHAIERNIVEWLALVADPADFDDVPVHFDDLSNLLAGYESIRPLSDAESAALAPMTALCHAEFALSEADYFLGVLHAPEKARMAVPDYLVGHARWFRSVSGAKLIEWLRAWADRRIAQPGAGRR